MTRSARVIMTAVVSVVLLLTGCSGQFRARFETSGGPLDTAGAEQLARTTDISALSRVKADDAPALRDKVLSDLRTHGAKGELAATLLTTGFPVPTRSVPVLVRYSKVDDRDAVIVVEAFGDAGGRLTHRRLWVFDADTGAIIAAASFR